MEHRNEGTGLEQEFLVAGAGDVVVKTTFSCLWYEMCIRGVNPQVVIMLHIPDFK